MTGGNTRGNTMLYWWTNVIPLCATWLRSTQYEGRKNVETIQMRTHVLPRSGLDRRGWALGGGPEMRRLNKDGLVDVEVYARSRGLKTMLGKCVAVLPDMDFPVNANAKSRVTVPWDRSEFAGQDDFSTSKVGLRMGNRTYIEDDTPDDDKNKEKRQRLGPLSDNMPAQFDKPRNFYASIRSAILDITSSSNKPVRNHVDWCTLHNLYPILSPARAKKFGDIKELLSIA
ncbi:hypothetical protein F5879DRAFT_928027 [Lentinula edodes]|nr:hypothetical protein F5879DRAFT_928027 [Lentinula edodes]